MVVIGAAGWLGWLVVDDDASSTAEAASSSTSAPAPSEPAPSEPSPSEPAATPTASEPAATPTPSDEPEPEQTTDAPAETRRDAQVAVLNNSGVVGAARTFSAKVAGAGWRVQGVGNWRGSIPANTVYYPAGLQEQAELLAKDVDVERVLPSVAPMRTDRLTIILSGPQ